MKRIHLFEFEDLAWFPNWSRRCLTRMMVVMHKILNTSGEMAELVNKVLNKTDSKRIVDLCSGSGGPMPEVVNILREKYGFIDIRLTMTDLFPNLEYAEKINSQGNLDIAYLTQSINATEIDLELKGLRTMVGSLHHMKPDVARQILKNAVKNKQPFCSLEISDNSFPNVLWWIAIPINILTSLVVSLFTRHMTWQQLVFTCLIPVIPITFAWYGAVSNARTYTLKDLDMLLKELDSDSYTWESGIINGKSKKIYLIGWPVA